MTKNSNTKKMVDQRGVVVIAVIIIAGILTTIGLSLAVFVTSQYARTTQNVFYANANLVAEAGIEQSMEQLNQDDGFSGYPTGQEFFNNTEQGRGMFVTTVVNGASGNEKIITSTGQVYRKNSTKVIGKRIIKVTAVGTGSSGYSVHTGVGGLILGGSANITNSDVFVNGTLKLTGAAKIGTNAQPLKVYVANQACPAGATPGATYPQVCTGTTQPISMDQSTAIYGTVCATGQTSTGPNNNIKPGATGQGLTVGCTAPVTSMPTYDRSAHIGRMTTTATGTSNNYVCASWPFQRTWPANLKLTGNVSINSSCEVTIKGDAYITGDLNIGGAAKITVDESVGTKRPVIVVDGKITVGGSGRIIANSQGTGIQFISYKSAASCAAACTALSGNDLKNSQVLETISVGGAVNLPGMVFQAYWGKVTIGGSGSIGAALGQTVDMSGAGTVTFGTTLSSGARTWTITSYQQKFQAN